MIWYWAWKKGFLTSLCTAEKLVIYLRVHKNDLNILNCPSKQKTKPIIIQMYFSSRLSMFSGYQPAQLGCHNVLLLSVPVQHHQERCGRTTTQLNCYPPLFAKKSRSRTKLPSVALLFKDFCQNCQTDSEDGLKAHCQEESSQLSATSNWPIFHQNWQSAIGVFCFLHFSRTWRFCHHLLPGKCSSIPVQW